MADQSLRPIRIEGDLAFVPLSQGREAVVDAVDVPLISQVNWYAHYRGGTFYAVRKLRGDVQRRMIFMHRVILGPQDKPLVDHIDGDGLNNRRSNLRPATHRENTVNCVGRRNSASGFKGVTILRNGKWRADIKQNGRVTCLGTFTDPKLAAAAYDKAALRIHGEFARLNLPEAT